MPNCTNDLNLLGILPPVSGHRHFEGAGEHPFKPRAKGREMVNAWWLAEASLLAYAMEEAAVPIFTKVAGFTTAEKFGEEGTKSTQGYVLSDDDIIVVAFRGTEIFQAGRGPTLRGAVLDVLTDVNLDFTNVAGTGGVHSGFNRGLGEVWGEVGAKLGALHKSRPGRTVWFTGHSLGGALATLAAAMTRDVQGLYTFGSPMVGNASFRKSFRVKNAHRFLHNNDLVAHLPFLGRPKEGLLRFPQPYHHVGELAYISSSGELVPGAKLANRFWDGVRGRVIHTFAKPESRKLPDWIAKLADDSFVDHAPLRYACNIWKIYQRELKAAPPKLV